VPFYLDSYRSLLLILLRIGGYAVSEKARVESRADQEGESRTI
jgi:hypothetical protein